MSCANETILYVDLKKLEKNFKYFKSKLNPKTKIIAVVKAFAYGHGDIPVSKKLETLGIYALWVSDFEEGIILRKSGVKIKIIVANPGFKSYNEIIKHKLDVVIYNHALLDLYCLNKKNTNVHLKFNTGMNRYGFDAGELNSIVSKIKQNLHIKILSICSHLAKSENNTTRKDTLEQIERFNALSKKFEIAFGEKTTRHLLSSHGVLNFGKHQMEAVRIGIGLYGSVNDLALKQISSLKSIVTQIRTVKKGTYIGYGSSFVSKKRMNIGVVPVGYADGINRRLSNSLGSVYINACEAPIIGKISMDSFIIDLTNIKAEVGNVVEIFGDNLNVSTIAKKINTIPYEIYSTLNRRIKRVYSE